MTESNRFVHGSLKPWSSSRGVCVYIYISRKKWRLVLVGLVGYVIVMVAGWEADVVKINYSLGIIRGINKKNV